MHGNKFAQGMPGGGPLIILKDGAENAQGTTQVLSNIKACQVVADSIRTTLGPRGMDKLIIMPNGDPIVSNDGATVLKNLEIVHPAARTLVDISQSQDSEVGDGTTTVTLLTSEILKNAVPFLEEGVHPQLVVKAYRKAIEHAVAHVENIAVKGWEVWAQILAGSAQSGEKITLKSQPCPLESTRTTKLPCEISSPNVPSPRSTLN